MVHTTKWEERASRLWEELAQGVDFQHLLDNTHDSIDHGFKRMHLLTRKDITNIERTYQSVGRRSM